MMKILHYIPEHFESADLTPKYLSVLMEYMDRLAEVQTATTMKQFKQIARDMQPHIVHIHACWSVSGYAAQRWATKHRFPVVLSLHGQLQPWHMRHHYLWQKLPLLIIGQRKVVKQADGIQVMGKMEQQRMERLGWNPRLALVANSLITNQISDQQMVSQMVAFYQKVIDSNSFRLMSDDDKEAESMFLRRAIHEKDEGFKEDTSLPPLNEITLRKIFIHANDEGILDEVKKGAAFMQQNTDNIVIEHIERFPQRFKKAKGALETRKLLSGNPLTKSSLKNIDYDEKPSDNEKSLVMALLNMQHELKHNTLSRNHLAQFYRLLRFTEYDEDMFQRMLRQLKLQRFAGRMLQILQESLHLEEGFMPLAPVNDSGTSKIRRMLLDINTQ